MQIKDLIPWAHKERSPEGKADPDNPVATLQREMNRVFEDFWGQFDRPNSPFDLAGHRNSTRCDVVETDDAVELSVELPGMEMKDIELTVSDDLLTLKGEKKIERKEEKKGYYLSERSYGSVYRTVPLPPGVDTDKAEASFKNGVLTVKVPKTEEAQAKLKRIEVMSA
ncbi:Hsp20/alpha crystallin family protein [Tropicimonas sp. IMCC6043]|uniref:Hsp20/alpha crystallin family protein n=1 Tax=Tropicimonas sp. IMCC6043 TaxID=2510645 RepID=UPI00101CB46E|nr:Hsp20/alpha crystallin family protein [Tropicimonas sp. IMCC6043]RYH07355.1 Hsp20/alpha crystallin family protein [Tropicimonas sp. IMCC6043]